MKNILAIAVAVLFVSGCGSDNNSGSKKSVQQEGKGNRFYGGVFRLNESEYIKSLFPHSITDAFSYRIASQIYEGLYKFDQSDLSTKPCLATDVKIDETRTIYTFSIKKGVFFHDNECFSDGVGREMTARDVANSFKLLCTQSLNNQNFYLFKDIVVGATEYYNATAGNKKPGIELEGIKVVDDFTLEIRLVQPYSTFLFNLARPGAFVFPMEAWEKYGIDMREQAVGTGPFMVSSIDDDISIILKKHEKYHGVDQYGNKLPFLDALQVQFIKDKKTEFFEFKKGNLDMIYRLPTDYIIEILEAATEAKKKGEYAEYQLQRKPEMMTHFLSFLTESKVFKDKNVRKAFAFAIDRERILDFVLMGEGYAPGFKGITPPTFKDYNTDDVSGYKQNIDSALYYMEKAGFPKGKGFPKVTLELNSDGERNTNVAVEIQKHLKDNLGVTVELNIVPFAQLVENITSGKSEFFRAGWVADYPSAENFLWLFLGDQVPANKDEKSYPNVTRYINKDFDRYYYAGLHAKNVEEANENFMKAENILMNDCPILVLWYDEGYRMLQSPVRNFPSNPMQFRDFSEVYFEPATLATASK